MKEIPTINDSTWYLYTDETREREIYGKYFEIPKKMCVNKENIIMKRNYYAVADIAAKTFLAYATIDCNMKIAKLYQELKPYWEKFQVEFSRRRFTELLKNVYIKTVNEQVKIAVLSTVIDTAFHHDDLYKYIVARMTADGKTGLIKVLHEMEQSFIESQPKDKIYRYLKPKVFTESEGRNIRYRKGDMKGMLEKGYDGGSYEWE